MIERGDPFRLDNKRVRPHFQRSGHWLQNIWIAPCRCETKNENNDPHRQVLQGDPEDELDKPGTTMRTQFSVLHGILIPFSMKCGFWPLIHSQEFPVSSRKLCKRWDCWRVLEDFHSQEYVQFFDMHRCLFMRLHFSIGGYDYRRTTRLRRSIHFSFTQVLFADHVQLTHRSRQQILVPQLKELMQAGTYFPKVRRMLFFLAPLI